MHYLSWTEHDIEGLTTLGVARLLTEIDDHGRVLREIGLDAEGSVVHRAPSLDGNRGLFDNQLVSVGDLRSQLSREEFEMAWRTKSERLPRVDR